MRNIRNEATDTDAAETRAPRNQVEALEKEIQELKYTIEFQKDEILGLYRRLYGQSFPMGLAQEKRY